MWNLEDIALKNHLKRYKMLNAIMQNNNIKHVRICAVVSLAILIGCTNTNQKIADIIYKNGKIYTVNESQLWAEAVALKDGKFLKVGTNDEILALKGAETEIIDLEGKFVMPGMSKPLLLTILNVQ